MGAAPRTSVVDKFGPTQDIPNLLVCDGSILPTQGPANPGLTIEALAARTTDYLISQGNAIFTRDRRKMTDLRYAGTRTAKNLWGRRTASAVDSRNTLLAQTTRSQLSSDINRGSHLSRVRRSHAHSPSTATPK